mgnify:FL=1|tara:strand:+ start:154 stop:420 length:267 start_codon:yes stop_codon:yes gene_type:complete
MNEESRYTQKLNDFHQTFKEYRRLETSGFDKVYDEYLDYTFDNSEYFADHDMALWGDVDGLARVAEEYFDSVARQEHQDELRDQQSYE